MNNELHNDVYFETQESQSVEVAANIATLNSLAKNFRDSLESYHFIYCRLLWNTSPLLRAWYSGYAVNVGTSDAPNYIAIGDNTLYENFSLLSNMTIILKDSLNPNFLHGLKSLNYACMAMMTGNERLQAVIDTHQNDTPVSSEMLLILLDTQPRPTQPTPINMTFRLFNQTWVPLRQNETETLQDFFACPSVATHLIAGQ